MKRIHSKLIFKLWLFTALFIFLIIQFMPSVIGQYSPEEQRDEYLPDWLGGTLACFVCCGGPIIWLLVLNWMYKDANSQG